MHIFIKNSFLFKIPTFLPHFKPVTMMHTVMFRVPMLSSERLDVVEELGQVRFNQFPPVLCTVLYYFAQIKKKQFCTPVQYSTILYTCTAGAAGVPGPVQLQQADHDQQQPRHPGQARGRARPVQSCGRDGGAPSLQVWPDNMAHWHNNGFCTPVLYLCTGTVQVWQITWPTGTITGSVYTAEDAIKIMSDWPLTLVLSDVTSLWGDCVALRDPNIPSNQMVTSPSIVIFDSIRNFINSANLCDHTCTDTPRGSTTSSTSQRAGATGWSTPGPVCCTEASRTVRWVREDYEMRKHLNRRETD